jgi:N-sulfoglucosamine sulfohydrolase
MTNIIMIDCHDLGQHLACYGWNSVPSEHLDKIASEGVRFENSFCTAPQCSPSRSALYTGRYPHANGMFGLAHPPFNWRMHNDEVHLAKLLQNAGYHTTQIGGQHLTAGNETAIQKLGFDQVHRCNDATKVGEHVVSFLTQVENDPFFLNIGFSEPHRDRNGRFGQAAADDSKGVMLPNYIPDIPEATKEFSELQGVIGKMDAAIGNIWAALDRLDLRNNTWVIFTTDHGLAMPRAKTTLYDPGIETALMMYSEPFGLIGGRVFSEMISNVDIVPTILDALEISIPDNIHGQSFWPLLQGKEYQPRRQIFAEKTFHTAYEPQRVIRSEHYKLIWNAEVDIINVAADIMHSPIYPHMIDELTLERPQFELYDLITDPHERINLAGKADHAEIEMTLRKDLLRWMQETNDPLLEGPIPSPYYHKAVRLLNGDGE